VGISAVDGESRTCAATVAATLPGRNCRNPRENAWAWGTKQGRADLLHRRIGALRGLEGRTRSNFLSRRFRHSAAYDSNRDNATAITDFRAITNVGSRKATKSDRSMRFLSFAGYCVYTLLDQM
jgi:hypothetical protein